MQAGFVNKQQELMWKAFKGECGSEFCGHLYFMGNFVEMEFEREGKFQGIEK